ncbi:antibiotic biosynthesis monooxygenase [Luteimonas sp. SJ-92]|uniref:Antibiotic biosynthesis monooxygenase n=1 Tax=Luteimonas salinisoli TaxID=2752307 RepID=A0A853J9I9_9GAMM|nr:antibiotic biosynthesis monooxygenase [Luteimonas salinisoli]NZA25349.1 antibiotic biosynthesis monooxygenase [Luteimonas salinisoli]
MDDAAFAPLPQPPYYAAVFASRRTRRGDDGYAEAAERMGALAQRQPGFLGIESVRGGDGFGITVSYWESEEAILAWRRHAEHTVIREQGRREWYARYVLRVAKVERAYGWEAADAS